MILQVPLVQASAAVEVRTQVQRVAGGKRCFEGSLLSGFFPNSNCFGVFSHSKGFGEESLSDSLWYSGADPSWAAKGFHKVSTKVPAKVPPRFQQGCSKVLQVSWCLWFSGANPWFGLPRFRGRFTKVSPRFPHHFFKLVSQFLNSFFAFSRTALALECSAIVKVLGQNDTSVLLDSFAADG